MTYKIDEVFEMLSSYGLTRNIQVVRRWIREGKLKAQYIEPNNRKIGQIINEADLHDFLQEEAPGVLELLRENKTLKDEIKQLKGAFNKEEKTVPVPKKKAEKTVEKKVKANPVKKKKETTEGVSIVRSEIQKMTGINKYDKQNLINYLFRDVPKGEKATVSLKEGQTLRTYLETLLTKEEFKFMSLDENGKEDYIRSKRGEMISFDVSMLCLKTIDKQNLERELGLVPGASNKLLHQHLEPVIFSDFGDRRRYRYTDLKRDLGFINPFTEEAFPTVEEAVLSALAHVFTSEFIEEVEQKKR